ncbi:hypothetical protein MKX01_021287 [Papaver californicum]|nr:hypothetical protein MKX01_021287 [Papaver californicum]
MDHSVEVLPSIRTKEKDEWKSRQIPSRMPSRIAQIRLVSGHPEVYEPCDDSFALVDAFLEDSAASVSYFATDINPHAVTVTSETLKAHTVHAEVLCDNIAASGLEKRLWGKVDVMVVNPPYVPTPEDEVGRDGIASAWAGGENGRTVIDKMLPVADKLLSSKGWLYMVTLAANKSLTDMPCHER